MSIPSVRRPRPRGIDVALLGLLVLLVSGAWFQFRPQSDDAPIGIDRSGRSVGTIKRFASVFVNGIEYSTAGAQITVDDRPATQAELHVGQIVAVDGVHDAADAYGVASAVEYRSNVLGPVSRVDQQAGTLIVLGQTVRIGSETAIDDTIETAALGNLRVGDVLAVSGNRASYDAIDATRVQRAVDTGEYRVAAAISEFDRDDSTFELNGLRVDFGAASIQGSLADDVPVRVVGMLDGNRLRATSVQVEAESLLGDEGDSMDLEGLVTQVTSATTFLVDEQPVLIGPGTRFEDGSASNLRIDARVLVRGEVDGGVIAAERVEFRRSSALKIEGFVRSTTAGGTRLSVESVVVVVDELTQYEDNSTEELSLFGPRDIRVGDYVEVSGAPAAGGSLLAHRIERDDPDTTTELRGRVTANNAGRLAVNGVYFSIDGRTEIELDHGGRMTRAQLLARARIGDRMRVKCFVLANGLRAKKIKYSGPSR